MCGGRWISFHSVNANLRTGSLTAYGFNSNRYTFCQKCFNEIPGDTVTLGDDPLQSQT